VKYMQFMLALGAVFVLVVIGACYLLGGFVARRSPRLLVALGGALLGLSCWFLFTGIHLYRLSETVHGADGWASLGPFLLGALRILVGLVLLPCAAPMLIRARDTAARRLIPLAFIPVLAVGATLRARRNA
jgi:cytochrome c biogenesis protein CcdA